MNVWDYIANHSTDFNTNQYKKWLDIKSGHFFSFEISHEIAPLSIQKKIARKAIEDYRETGNYLLYLSSKYYTKNNSPVFLCPIFPEFSNRNKTINWNRTDASWLGHPSLFKDNLIIEDDELDTWMQNQSVINQNDIVLKEAGIYFNYFAKKIIEKDIQEIYKKTESSLAIDTLFNKKLKPIIAKSELNFLDFRHILSLDYSQAEAIINSKNQSIVISGPPGTGKSQTIINLALEEIAQGKKVAILSKKRTAVDVIKTRLDAMNQNYIYFSNLEAIHNPELVIKNIENSLDRIRQSIEIPLIENVNLTYYQHCIRILEDYYLAYNEHILDSQNQFPIEIYKNINFLKWISPKKDLINNDFLEIHSDLNFIYQNLKKLSIEFQDESFDDLVQLSQISEMLISTDKKRLKMYLKDTKYKKSASREIKALQIHLKKKPINGIELSELSEDKLEYYKNRLINSNRLMNILDNKTSLIMSEVILKIPNWKLLDTWSKVDIINETIKYKEWNKIYLELSSISQNNSLTQYPQIFEYIDNKLNSNIPVWKLIKKYWIDSDSLDLFDSNIISILQKLTQVINYHKEFKDFLILNFLNEFDANLPSLTKLDWQNLCSEDRGFIIKNSNSEVNHKKVQFPILKNYSKKEIVLMAQYCRRHYLSYSKYKGSEFSLNFNKKKIKDLESVLKNKTEEGKLMKNEWKSSIKYIEKNWSDKRKKPSIYHYIRSVDLDFLLWLKPMYIGTLDQCSQYLPLQNEMFDTLILDESSQIEVMDAIPAMYRSKKLIVVGDNKQLTPTKFFRLQNTKDSLHENILELAEEKLPKFQLNYHYRSENPILIQYSNHNFYKNSLKVSRKLTDINSIEWIYLENGIYQNRVNVLEAKKVIEIISNMAIQNLGDKTIGIICFSVQQKMEIEDQLDETIQSNLNLYNYIQFQKSKIEYFFIQNLENVQGDERDIIIVSSGYAKNEKGLFYQYFGPILAYKGENRLNVLMSRAREKIYFVSSIRSSDIQVSSSSSNGLILFKKLFEFLETKTLTIKLQDLKFSNYWEYFLNPFRK